MRNNALPFTAATLVLGIFAAFLRWLQNMNVFDEATGLARHGAAVSIVLVLYVLACAVIFAALSVVWLRRFAAPEQGPDALRAGSVLPAVCCWVCAGAFVLCALVLMFTAPSARQPNLQRVFAAAAIFGGLCFPFLPQSGGDGAGFSRVCAGVLTLVCCFWLVVRYTGCAAEEPVLWRAAPETLALAATTLAFFRAAGWLFGVRAPRRTLFFLQLAAFLDLAVMFDSRGLPYTVMLLVCAVMCLLLELLFVGNLKER